MNIKSRIN